MDITRYLSTKSLQVLKFTGFLAVYLIVESVFEIASDYVKKPLDARHLLGFSLVLIAGGLALIGWRYGKQLEAHNPRKIGRKKPTAQQIAQLIWIFVLMTAVQIFWQWLISKHILTLPSNQQAVNAAQMKNPVLNIFFAGFLAPIFEELIFRGIFMNYFFNKDNRLNNILAVLVSGAIFGFAHELSFDATWIMYSILGCCLSFAYMHFRDIRYSIALHMMNNLIP
ncbi:CAAX amino terminal protease self- immunity [Lentilactobacillus sunkii]|jgi:membrane protease YdiL (CAAX protease family)|uniref:CAAX amino terminal protease self-immunity n=1 Tax=Lentilactobacillus sunkii TaxID=481719 RepID=A0A1E7XE22_9LACO|nr:CPBP family intramembrane glutamic endopeptidase [Lentilactobacillus sunkii]OFA11346.1 CAAX amino terminal protease self- immunity [Lentilactobacillus sunkii]